MVSVSNGHAAARGDFRARSRRSRRARRRGGLDRCRAHPISRRTRLGMLLTAPGKTSQTPTVATVSIAPVDLRGGLRRPARFRRRRRNASWRSRHQHGAGVAAFAFDPDAQAGRRGDRRDDAERNAVPFQQRALFDVQFDEGARSSPRGSATRCEVAGEAGRGAAIVQRAAVAVAQARRRRRRRAAPASRRLPKHPMPKRVGSSAVKIRSSIERRGRNAGALQRADRFESAEHADGAVVARRRSEWRRCASRCRRRAASGSAPLPAREGVADGVFANVEAGVRGRGPSRSRARAGPVSEKTTRVTAGAGASEKVASVSSSRCEAIRVDVRDSDAVPVFVDQIFRGRLCRARRTTAGSRAPSR